MHNEICLTDVGCLVCVTPRRWIVCTLLFSGRTQAGFVISFAILCTSPGQRAFPFCSLYKVPPNQHDTQPTHTDAAVEENYNVVVYVALSKGICDLIGNSPWQEISPDALLLKSFNKNSVYRLKSFSSLNAVAWSQQGDFLLMFFRQMAPQFLLLLLLSICIEALKILTHMAAMDRCIHIASCMDDTVWETCVLQLTRLPQRYHGAAVWRHWGCLLPPCVHVLILQATFVMQQIHFIQRNLLYLKWIME